MRSLTLLVTLAIIDCLTVSAQELVTNFHSPVAVRASYLTNVVKQPDGKILLGGDIDYYINQPVGNLIRITADGQLDPTFSFTHDDNYYVHDMELRPDGSIVVLAREFHGYINNAIFGPSKILIVNGDGSVENEIGTTEIANAIALQDDGKILVASEAYYTGEENFKYLTRFNSNLTEDTEFKNAVSFDSYVDDVQSVGNKIYCSGRFSNVNGVTKNDVVKLNLDGSVDNTFDTGAGTDDYIGAITITPNGKVILGNTYINTFNGVQCHGIARLNANGSLDESFQPDVFANGAYGKSFLVGDAIYVSAYLWYSNDDEGAHVFKLNQDGSQDKSFKQIPVDFFPFNIQIAVTDDAVFFNGPPRDEGNIYGVSRSDFEGNLDDTFNPRISRLGIIKFGDQQNDQMIVAGDFTRIDDLPTFGIARLNSNGTVDYSFQAKERTHPVQQIHLFESGSVLVSTGDDFFKLDDVGDRINTFKWTPASFNLLYQVNQFAVLDNGQIMAADPNTIARLNSNGSLDESFNIGHTSNSTAFSFDMQGDSVIYGYTRYDDDLETFRSHVDRITPDGTFDQAFESGAGPQVNGENDWPSMGMIKVLDNKEILVGGWFQKFDGESVPHGLVKLSKNGKMDLSFNENQKQAFGPTWFFDPQVEQIGDKIYIRGIDNIYVINLDGTVDSFTLTFNVDAISDIIPLPEDGSENGRKQGEGDGYIVALGSFETQQSTGRLSVVKIALGNSPTEEPEEPNVTTGIDESQKKLALQVFPQPTSHYLNIKFDNNGSDYRASIYSLSGQVMMERDFSAGSEVNSIDVSNVPVGMYALKVTSKSGKSATVKFIRSH